MNRIEVRLAGTGGQGLQLAARILADAVLRDGHHVAQSQSYEPTSRGGLSRSDIVIDDSPLPYPLATNLDLLLVLAQDAAGISDGLLAEGGLVLIDDDLLAEPPSGSAEVHRQPLTATARRLGSQRITNVVSLGALAGLRPVCTFASLEAAVEQHTPTRFHDLNLQALHEGHSLTAASRVATETAKTDISA